MTIIGSACRALTGQMALVATIFIGATAHAQTQPSFDGVWRIAKPVPELRTLQGQVPPLTPAAAKEYRERIAQGKRGDRSFDSATWCASVGMPRIMFINYPFQIMAGRQHVAFLHEWNWWARIVYLDGALSDKPLPPPGPPPGMAPGGPGGPPGDGPPGGGPPGGGPPGGGPPMMAAPSDTPGPMGLSKGRWEGDTLVVQTEHIDTSKLLDDAGLPHSAALKVTEHLRLTGPDTLEDRIRFDDPATFTNPWETIVSFRRQPGAQINEDSCLDRIKAGQPALQE